MTRLLAPPLLALSAALLVAPMPARGADEPAISAADQHKAITHYRKGKQLFALRRYEEALGELDASLALMPSPNTELLRAHCLRELGRRIEAGRAYESVIKQAQERVDLGEKRYQGALDDATRWWGELRRGLARLRVVVRGAPGPVTISVDGSAVEAGPTDDPNGGVQAELWREPGQVVLEVVGGEGSGQRRSVDLSAGQSETIEFDLSPTETPVSEQPAPTGPEPAPEPEEAFPMPPLPSWIAAGVGVAGFGLFAIFGSLSASTASDLDECAPSCPDALREDADAGKTQQTVANVSLVVGVAGLAAAGTFWLVDALTSDGEPDSSPEADEPEPTAAIGIAPTGVWVQGTF